MRNKIKILQTLGVVGIILLAVFVVTTQYQISEINNREEAYPLFVKVFADKTEGLEPLAVNLSAIVDYYEGDLKYNWDFGNGNTSQEISPTAVYEKDGNYVCSLEIMDDNGETKTDKVDILVKKNKPPVVTLSINKNNIDRVFKWTSLLNFIPLLSMVLGYPGNQQKILDYIESKFGENHWGDGRIEITAQVSDPENDEIISYEWVEQTADSLLTFGGEVILPVHEIEGNETIVIPEIYTWMPYEHVVTLTVTDSAGNKANATIDFMVSESIQKSKIKQIKNLIGTVILDTIYEQYLSEEQKHLISDPIWKIIEPFDKIISKIPGISLLWGLAIGFIANKFPPPVPVAELACSFDNNIYDHTTTVDSNGGVTNNVSISHKLKIKNNDNINPAKDVYILLKSPVSNQQGLSNNLEKNQFTVTLKTADATKTLYINEGYTNGFSIGDLEPGADFTADLTVSFKTAEDGTFVDNQNYNSTLYIHQDGADYQRWNLLLKRPSPKEVKFEIKT